MRKYYLFIVFLTIIVGGIVVWGIMHAGNPFKERATNNDSTRLAGFNSIKYDIDNYVAKNGTLPNNVKDIQGMSLYLDPISKKPYEYKKKGTKTYEMCAVFETLVSNTKADKTKKTDLLVPTIQPHKKGKDCVQYELSNYTAALISPTPTPAPPPILVGYWKLDDLNPRYGIFDEVPQENNGIIVNVNEVEGKVNKAGYFKGTNDSYIAVTQNKGIPKLTGDFTLSLWTSRYDTGSRAIASTTNNTDGGFGMFVGNKGEVYCRTSQGGGGYTDSYSGVEFGNRVLPNTGWHHVAIVKSGNLCDIYIDGARETAISSQHKSILGNTNPLTLGGLPNHFDQSYTGLIDEVRLYNFAQTKEQILKDMNTITISTSSAASSL